MPDREELKRLYVRARTLLPAARSALVEEASGGDAGMRDEVLSLLEHADPAERFFRHLSRARAARSRTLRADHASPPTGPFTGDTVRHFRIFERIGSGGMGSVYRAHDTRLARDVALKFLPDYLTSERDARELLLAEARAAAALEHPNVCTIHEIGETSKGRPFIAMALYEGETLKDRLRRTPLSPEEAARIAAQIARGLAAAHERGFVHRDVKPGNIMLTPDGTAKLLDFGLARVSDATLTRPGATPGTVAYMSPEQVRGDPLDARTDLWSLGVVLYEMLAGARPFPGGSEGAVIHAVLSDAPPPIRTRRPDTPDSLQRITDRLLRKEPSERYGSARELLAELEGSHPGRRWPSRLRTRAGALGAGASAAALLGAIGLFLGVRMSRDADPLSPAADATATAPAIAVLPFSVHGEGLDVWREGMVDLLSTGLDGAAGLRAIDSRTVLARWREEAGNDLEVDLPRALAAAGRTGASFALVGSAVAAGPELRLITDIYDLERDRSVGQTQVQGSADSVFALVDGLAMRILEEILEEDPATFAAIDLAGITTSSLPALKAFLEGEVRFRRSDFPGAIEAWKRAVAVDTLFALAYLRLVEAYGWDSREGPRKYEEMLDRAHTLADRLPAREARLVRAKRLRNQGRFEGVTALEELVRDYPDDADAWYELGEAYYHNTGAMHGPEEAEHAFQRAAELQPTSAPLRIHLIELAFGWRPDSARIAHELEAYGRLAPQSQPTRAGRIALGIAFGGPAGRARARAALDTLDSAMVGQVYLFLRHPRFAAEREAVYLAFGSRLHDEGVPRPWLRFIDVGAVDGRVRTALGSLDDPLMPPYIGWCGPLVISVLGLPVPAETLEEALSPDSAGSSAFLDPRWVTCAVAYAAERGRWSEHAALLSHARERAGAAFAAGDTASGRDWNRTALEAEAHRLWRHGRKAEALSKFESLLSNHTDATWVLGYVGRLAFELGQPRLAEKAFRARWEWQEPAVYLYLARIYEQTGRTAEAAEAYELVIQAWKDADPELQPAVQRARSALARVAGAHSPGSSSRSSGSS